MRTNCGMKLHPVAVKTREATPADRELSKLTVTLDHLPAAAPGLSADVNARRLNQQIEAMARANIAATGADGWRSALLPSSTPSGPGRMLWGLGDTFITGVEPDGKRLTPYGHPEMFVRGTVLLQDGKRFDTITASDTSRFSGRGGFVEPAATKTVGFPQMPLPSRWYWPGVMQATDSGVDMVLNDWGLGGGNPYVWDWKLHGTDIVHIDPDHPVVTKVQQVTNDDTVIWGAASVSDDKHTYIYGAVPTTAHGSKLAVARVPKGNLSAPWEYKTADGWSNDSKRAERVLGELPNQFSVVQAKDGYALLAQPMMNNWLDVYKSSSPLGPFKKTGTIPLHAPQAQGRVGYQAIVSDGLSDPDNLLIAINQSNLETDAETGLFSDFRHYLPHFQSVPRP